MTHFLSRDLEGVLEVNHQASPGLNERQARRLGYDGRDNHLLREGGVYRTPTLSCCHCPSVVVLNPLRTRGRHYCPKCNQYMCDACHIVACEPDYVHRSRQELIDMIRSGKWRFAGGSMSAPVLLPIIGD
jgi:hypothetical protein